MSPFAAASHLPSGNARLTMSRSWWKLTVAISLGTGMVLSIVAVVFEFAQRYPTETFALLRQWGPWLLIITLCLVLLSNLLNKGIEGGLTVFRESTQAQMASAEAQKASAEAQGRTADAMTRLADQGSKQAEEVRRLSIYAAREFPNVYDRFDKQDAVLGTVARGIEALHGRLDRLKEHDKGATQ